MAYALFNAGIALGRVVWIQLAEGSHRVSLCSRQHNAGIRFLNWKQKILVMMYKKTKKKRDIVMCIVVHKPLLLYRTA